MHNCVWFHFANSSMGRQLIAEERERKTAEVCVPSAQPY